MGSVAHAGDESTMQMDAAIAKTVERMDLLGEEGAITVGRLSGRSVSEQNEVERLPVVVFATRTTLEPTQLLAFYCGCSEEGCP